MQELDDHTFDAFVQRNGRVLVMFHAPWAGPCKLARPAFEEASERVRGVVFATFNLDDNPETPARVGVRAVPLFMLFDRAKIKGLLAGAVPADAIVEMCDD